MEAKIKELQSLVKEGHFNEAYKRLRMTGKWKRKSAAELANIAWRINQPALAVKNLNPIVRPKDQIQDPATSQEKIEYAESLRRLGAVDEAWQLLTEVDEDQFPQALLYKIFCLFNQWRYEEALPLLRRYLNHPKLEAYARSVGKINFAAALIQVGSLQEAELLLATIRTEMKNAGLILLYGNSLELSAQVFIQQNKFDEALAVLQEASGLLKDAGSVFALFVEKWTAIAESLKCNSVTQSLWDVFAKAKAVKHWETLRDCDLYITYINQDWDRYQYLYCGTPFESFRKRILKFAGPQFQMPPQCVWSLSEHPQTIFDLGTGKVSGLKKGHLPIGQALHRFMIVLARDLYRPVPALTAFSKLFPGEFLNTETSVNRVHQIVKRCRQWIRDVGLNLQIEEIDGNYRLVLGEGLGLILSADPLPLDHKELEWRLLEQHVGQAAFDIKQAMQVLGSSPSNTHRLFKWALEQGRVQKSGKGSRTSYRITSR